MYDISRSSKKTLMKAPMQRQTAKPSKKTMEQVLLMSIPSFPKTTPQNLEKLIKIKESALLKIFNKHN